MPENTKPNAGIPEFGWIVLEYSFWHAERQ